MTVWSERQATRISKARSLLAPGVPPQPGIWGDLGCGDGIFTAALYLLLGPEAEIHALDADARQVAALVHNFRESYPQAHLHPQVADFTQEMALPPLDGIVMANALHFHPGAAAILRHIAGHLVPDGRLIVVEYNTRLGNRAVPHPLDDQTFLSLVQQAGYRDAQILARIPSTFLGEMYAGLALWPGDDRDPH